MDFYDDDIIFDDNGIIIDDDDIIFDKNGIIIELTAEPGKPIVITEIPPKNRPDCSDTQENHPPIDMERSSESIIDMQRNSEGSPTYHHRLPMPIEQRGSAPEHSDIFNKPESESEIDIKKSIAEILEICRDLLKSFINGSKSTESDLQTNLSSQPTEDRLFECIKAVTKKLTDWNKETFRKVELTKALQKKFNAKEIDAALNSLLLPKIIIPVPEEAPRKGGRKPSQKYRINTGRF